MDPDDSLDFLGQQPGLNIYTQICFCFSVTNDSSYLAIITKLKIGLERLSASFPWIAGQVVNKGSGEGSTGIFLIEPLAEIPQLVVKDLRDDPLAPTMETLRQAMFPFSMLDEAIIAPRRTLPGHPDESTLDLIPVLLLQASFIAGGLLLTILGQHQTMDMTGQGQVIRLLSKACYGEQFANDELSSGNLTRSKLVPLFDDSYKPGPEIDALFVKQAPADNLPSDTNDLSGSTPPPKCSWAYFVFNAASLSALKKSAIKSITLSTSYISTDDTLTAFVWQSIIRARLHRLDPTTESILARAVDVRHYLDIPRTYPGLMQNMTYTTSKLQKLAVEPLGVVASQLRSALDPKTSDIKYRTRALATFLDRVRDKNTVSIIAMIDVSKDIMLSSWAKVDCYSLDFNLGLGKPESVRRPQFDPVESLIYLMPKTLDGDITIGVCLRDADMERLKMDEEFNKYGTYIG